jgi:iron complex transport system substrate-binding protein
MKGPVIIVIFLLFAASGCRQANYEKGTGSEAVNSIVTAERLAIERHENYSIVTIINPWQGTSNMNLVYCLARKGSELPAGIDSAAIVWVPVDNIICMSASYAAMISALGKEETISAVSGKDLLYSPALNIRIESGLIRDVGYEASLNNELIVEIAPDIVMMYGVGGESAGYAGKLKELGMKILFNADYLETDPLGKAEWIKLFGALYCKEKEADSIYNAEVQAYKELRDSIVDKVNSYPKVLLGLPFKDTWYISPGNSYISRLIADAGGKYLWNDTESGISMPYGLESVYQRAVNASFWLNTGTAASKQEIAAIDRRFTELPCYMNDKVFNNNHRMTPKGGNDYYETGAVYPHLILSDMIKIFHPEVTLNHELFFFKKLQ